MGSTSEETVTDVMAAWNETRTEMLEKDTMDIHLLSSSIWMDRLFHAHLREGKPKVRQGRKPREIVPTENGPQKVE